MQITQAQFNQWQAAGYNYIPVMQELLADLETPLSLYLKVANTPYSYFEIF